MERLRQADPARYDQILLRLRRYDQRLQRFGLRDRHLDWQLSTRDVSTFAVREIAFGIVLLPLCAPRPRRVLRAVSTDRIHRQARRPPARRARHGAGLLRPRHLRRVARRGRATIVWWAAGRTAAVAATLLMPVVAVAALFAIERESAVIDAVRAWWLLRRAHRDTRARLRRRRSELADLLDEVNRCGSEAGGQRPEVRGPAPRPENS